jgi:uncharacterized membrane-anchored protein
MLGACLLTAVMSTVTLAQSTDDELGIRWQKGPAKAALGNQAEVHIPAGYQFAGASETRHLLELMQNPTSGRELGLIATVAEDQSWFVVFEFNEIGYVKDDEKEKLDADAMLNNIRQGTEQANIERKKRGWSELHVVGWEQPPRYDEKTNNLEWATRAESDGLVSVNYNIRLLGRHGVMEVTVVADPKELASAVRESKALLAGFSYTPGNRYAEFRQGDRIAEYGLAALITGGAAAVALKTGLFQKLWKVIVFGGVAVVAAVRKLFGRRAEA